MEKAGEYTIEVYSNPFRLELHDQKHTRALLKTVGPVKITERIRSNILYKKPYYFYFGGRKKSVEYLNTVSYIFQTDSCR